MRVTCPRLVGEGQMKFFRNCLCASILFCLVVPSTQAQRTRRGIFKTVQPAGLADKQDYGSFFTIGTLFGISYSLDDASTYKLQNDIVVFDDERGRLRPGVFALPSIALV